MEIKARECEVCGKPAYNFVRDLQEIEPKNGWKQYEYFGGIHWLCDEHDRESIEYPREHQT